jgi:hypothetical protein
MVHFSVSVVRPAAASFAGGAARTAGLAAAARGASRRPQAFGWTLTCGLAQPSAEMVEACLEPVCVLDF